MKKVMLATIVATGLAGIALPVLAGDYGIAGKKIQLKQGKKNGKLVFLAKHDEGIQGLTQEEIDSASGAFLTVCAGNGQSGEVELPLSGLSVKGKGIVKFKAKGKVDGVKNALIKPGKTLKIVGKSTVVPMSEGQALEGVAVRLTIGDLRMCTVFGDPLRDDGATFKARGGTGPVDCDDVTLGCASPSGAFVD